MWVNWDPWTGCYAVSDGCRYCYYYGPYSKRYGQNTVTKTSEFDKPVSRKAKGDYVVAAGKTIATCFATDFFIAEADEWRKQAWEMIAQRPDLDFLILTKRIDRFTRSLPEDWGDGYDNVYIGCTVETQQTADERLPLFCSFAIKRRFIACSPLLGPIDLSPYFKGIDRVSVGGETSREARVCDYSWVTDIRRQCAEADVSFWFKNTGSLFRRNGELSRINPYQQSKRAKELDINILADKRMF